MKNSLYGERNKIKTIKEGYFQTVNEDNFTSCIRDQESERDENKGDKCRQHLFRHVFENFVKTVW